MILHDFHQCLALSQSKRLEPIWEGIYRNAFPGFVNMTAYPTNGDHQWSGIDRSIQLYNGVQIFVDEKWRWKAYPDILLEYVSNDQAMTLGWVCKPLRAHYIAYAIGPVGMCYLLPVIQLQKAWKRYGQEWLKAYKTVTAHTKTFSTPYATLNCPVPVSVVYKAIGEGLRQSFGKVSEDEWQ